MPTKIQIGDEDTLSDAMRAYEEAGAEGQFSARPAESVHCHGCGAEEPAAQTPVVGMHRFEGATDPDEEAVLVALECVACGDWGTMVLPFGPETPPEEAAVLAALLDARDQSNIPLGT